jgi:DNA (cytosine-5)-methyltransferase 1
MSKKTFVDLFSGCGGFSLGAKTAGYENILSVDIDPMLTSSYKLNFPKSNLVLADLAKIENIKQLLIDPKAKPDLLIGGPPCQGFSFMGKRNEDDPRNQLIYHFFRHVKKLCPNIFILENVEGLASGYGLEVIAHGISQLPSYYKVTETIQVNANDFGAATSRPRVLIIGHDTRYIDTPNYEKIIASTKGRMTVKDAISDLPSPTKSDSIDFDWAKYKETDELSSYALALRKRPKNGLGWTEAIERLENGFISGLASTLHTTEVKERFRQTKQGDNEPVSRFFKLKWDMPSRTIRAGTGRDKGGFQSARPIHPTQARVITVREAARIQGFPDWFVFHPTKWHSFRMIGNSVSPIMAEKLISKIQG